MCRSAVRWTGVARLGLERYYRLIYSTIATVTLLAVVWVTPRQNETLIWVWGGPLRIIQTALWIVSAIIAYKAFKLIGVSELLGLTAFGIGRKPAGRQDDLITWGIYGVVRHPQFLAGLIIVWARDLTDTSLVISIVLSLYLFAGVLIEERRMLRRLGEPYRIYRNEVPRFIPKLPGN